MLKSYLKQRLPELFISISILVLILGGLGAETFVYAWTNAAMWEKCAIGVLLIYGFVSHIRHLAKAPIKHNLLDVTNAASAKEKAEDYTDGTDSL